MDDVDVWSLTIDPDRSDLDQLWLVLSTDEQERANHYVFADDRHRFVVARSQLRQVLAGYVQDQPRSLAFELGPFGKPALVGAHGLHFSHSRSGTRALVAVAQGHHVGVDVEAIRAGPAEDLVVSRFLSADERAAIERLPPDRRDAAFFACWTRKEAYVKGIGAGLSMPLDSFSVSVIPGERNVTLDAPLDRVRWTIQDLRVGAGYAAALAVQGDDWQTRRRSLNLDGSSQEAGGAA